MTSLLNDKDMAEREDTSTATRRSLLTLGVLGLTLGLSACGGGKSSLAGQHLSLARNTFFAPKSQKFLTKEEVAKFPYASMAIKVGGRPEQLILLSRFEGRKLIWLSGDGILLATVNGRIVQTGGLRKNLKATSFVGYDPVSSGLLDADGLYARRFLDYETDYGLSLEAISQFRVQKEDPINVLGTTLSTVRVEEKVRVPLLKWRYKNIYWVHKDSQFVWRTRQIFHPENKPYVLTMLRPASLPG